MGLRFKFFFSVYRSKKEKRHSNTMRWYIFLLKLPPEGSEFLLFLNGPRKKTAPCERQKHMFIHSLNSWSLLFTVKSVKTIETRRSRCRNFYKAKKKKKRKKSRTMLNSLSPRVTRKANRWHWNAHAHTGCFLNGRPDYQQLQIKNTFIQMRESCMTSNLNMYTAELLQGCHRELKLYLWSLNIRLARKFLARHSIVKEIYNY